MPTSNCRTCRQATVLIGANGSGKSNFMRFFEMLSWMLKTEEAPGIRPAAGRRRRPAFWGQRDDAVQMDAEDSNAYGCH